MCAVVTVVAVATDGSDFTVVTVLTFVTVVTFVVVVTVFAVFTFVSVFSGVIAVTTDLKVRWTAT